MIADAPGSSFAGKIEGHFRAKSCRVWLRYSERFVCLAQKLPAAPTRLASALAAVAAETAEHCEQY